MIRFVLYVVISIIKDLFMQKVMAGSKHLSRTRRKQQVTQFYVTHEPYER